MIDMAPLMRKVAELADDLERIHGPDAELVVGVIAVEVLAPDEDGDPCGHVHHRSTTHSNATALGVVELTATSLRTGWRVYDDLDDE